MNRRVMTVGLCAVCVLSGVSWSAFRAVAGGAAMTGSAVKFLASLSDDQRRVAVMDYDTPKRVDWHFIPKDERKGLQIKDMNESQRQAAHALLKSALSEIGYGKAVQIMELESLLRELEKNRKGPLRDPERYYFTVFGQPSEESKWGLSVEGHHLSLNFVVEKGKVVSSTPTVYAANPAIVKSEVPGGPPKGTRVLAKEEQLAFDLLHSLQGDQRKTAVIDETAPREIRAAGEAQPPQAAAEGIPAAKLSADQQKQLRALIEAYVENLPGEVAEDRWSAIRKGNFEQVHFAWAGADKPGIGHYYRVQGPSFLIEFVNTQPDAAGNPANHIHAIWRDMQGDFAIPVRGGN